MSSSNGGVISVQSDARLFQASNDSQLILNTSHPAWKLASKRAFDVVLSALTLLLVSPLMLFIAVLLKLDSEGPVFYSQLRVGQNKRRTDQDRRQDVSVGDHPHYPDRRRVSVYGDQSKNFYFYDRRKITVHGKPFKIYKFRSMYTNAEANGKAVWSTDNDPRITRFGSFLRKSHLDEIPQLINVLRGDMSWVGPRPERPVFVGELSKQVRGYKRRLVLKPGLTGPAQICLKPDAHIDDVRKKVRYDWHYVKNVSLRKDITIILGTVPFVFGVRADQMRKLNRARFINNKITTLKKFSASVSGAITTLLSPNQERNSD